MAKYIADSYDPEVAELMRNFEEDFDDYMPGTELAELSPTQEDEEVSSEYGEVWVD